MSRPGLNVMLFVVMLPFRVFGAAVLTEPAITHVEEMSGLMHYNNTEFG